MVRRAVKLWVQTNENIDQEDLCGACAIASYALCEVLEALGYKPTMAVHTIGLECHCWVELNGWVIDLTATQYDTHFPVLKHPEVNIVPIGTAFGRSYFYTADLRGEDAFNKTRKWDGQSPLIYRRKIQQMVKKITLKTTRPTKAKTLESLHVNP